MTRNMMLCTALVAGCSAIAHAQATPIASERADTPAPEAEQPSDKHPA